MTSNSTPTNISQTGKHVKDTSSFLGKGIKRFFDCLISGLALILISPILLLFYVLVKKEDHGPAIYSQERIGRNGKPFTIYKFRSMRMDAEQDGPELCHESESRDPRLTIIGGFLRHHHLDELPQLWNVFIGDMALVGPRPERKFYIDQIMEHDSRYADLYQLRPGVTSHATLYNGYTDTMEKMLKRLEYDLDYLEYHNLWIDLTILSKTFSSIVFGKRF